MQVDIQLVGKSNHWVYQQRRIRIGRDSSCDISLSTEEYPMVSREHVVLEFSDGILSLSDPRSGNGTYLGGNRVTSARLQSGDTIRLGEDGPELRISLNESTTQTSATTVNQAAFTQVPDMATKVVEQATTVFDSPLTVSAASASMGAVDSPTVVAGGVTVTNVDATVQRGAGAAAQPVLARSREVRISLGNDRQPPPPPKVPAPAILPKSQLDIGDQEMIEQKLGSIQTLLVVNLVVVLALILGLVYQSQQIERNRKALNELRTQAQSAVGQFAPELDNRLSSFDKRMDSMDGKMKAEEEHFIQRMNTEIPSMLDKYIDRKLNDAKHQAAVAKP
jgi:pSer/pThr/pTyr-binding forkhead associated (FHA) protein